MQNNKSFSCDSLTRQLGILATGVLMTFAVAHAGDTDHGRDGMPYYI